jgi:hypothetical protein
LVVTPANTGISSRPRGYIADLATLVVGGSAFFIAVILWFDNAQGGLTGNGVFHSYQLRPWITDPANAQLDQSNFLYYPIFGAGCRLLDLLGIFVGDPRRQVTILNALCGAVCLGVVYALVRHLTQNRSIALLASFFHGASAFVLFLAITNEDIMPGYTIVFAAMALASVWFAHPTILRVLAVAVLFTVGWLFEWRLIIPTLPAMMAALWLCESRLSWRIGWNLVLLAGVFLTTCAVSLITMGHSGSMGPLDLLWTGKGVATVWAGFSWIKLYFLADGIAAYLLGTALTEIPHFPGWDVWRFLSIGISAAIAWVVLGILWRARDDNRSWALAAVFGGTFAAGEVLNVYSQPHDPQMQINVMGWLTVGWALMLVAARKRWPKRGLAVFTTLAALLLVYNLISLVPLRGQDTDWRKGVERMEQRFDTSRLVLVMHDFDWVMTYTSAFWGRVYPGVDDLGAAPQANPKFKWIGFASAFMLHPDWTDDAVAAELRRQIDRALALGYDVVIVNLWDMDRQFLEHLNGSIAPPARIRTMWDMLHRDFVASQLPKDPLLGSFYRLERAPGR